MRIALLVAVLISGPALAAETKTADAQAAAAESTSETKKEKKICKRIPASESRLAATRVCRTASEWKGEQSDYQRVKSD